MRRLMKIPAMVGLLLLGVLGCGGGTGVGRPLEVDVRQLSARAEALVIRLFPAESGQNCQGVSLANVAMLDTDHEFRWVRSEASEGDERRFEFDESIEGDTLTIMAFSEDPDGRPIQFVCHVVEWQSIAGPIAIVLSDRVR